MSTLSDTLDLIESVHRAATLVWESADEGSDVEALAEAVQVACDGLADVAEHAPDSVLDTARRMFDTLGGLS